MAVYLAFATTILAGLLCGVAILRLRRQAHNDARRFALFSMWASMAFLPILFAWVVFAAASAIGPESKATLLARGISAAMNCGILDIPVGLTSLIVWLVARARHSRSARDEIV